MLVLEHGGKFTKGIILNRPTLKVLPESMGGFTCWFGGDVQSFNSNRPDYVCLHSLTSLSAQRASMNVIQDISWTTIENAIVLIEQGDAKREDFWVFCGYAGWGPDQLKGEVSFCMGP